MAEYYHRDKLFYAMKLICELYETDPVSVKDVLSAWDIQIDSEKLPELAKRLTAMPPSSLKALTGELELTNEIRPLRWVEQNEASHHAIEGEPVK